MHEPKDPIKKKILNKKWQELKKRGIFPPKDEEERIERLKAAHGY